jgi:hypothetical protein
VRTEEDCAYDMNKSKHHFIRERVLEGEIGLDYISTDDNPADLTKPLPRHKFKKQRDFIGIRSLQQKFRSPKQLPTPVT